MIKYNTVLHANETIAGYRGVEGYWKFFKIFCHDTEDVNRAICVGVRSLLLISKLL